MTISAISDPRPEPDAALFGDAFAAGAGEVSSDEALAAVEAAYGKTGRILPLPGERDHNFRLTTYGGTQFVLKFAHPGEAPAVTLLQTAALRHIAAADPTVPAPRVLPTLGGRFEQPIDIGGARRTMRLLDYRAGTPLHAAPPSPRQLRNVGRAVADLDRSLQGFDHPGADHNLAWDIRHVRRMEALLPFVSRRDKLPLLRRALDRFDKGFSARLAETRTQVIHNDANLHNVLVAPGDPDTVAGIIDFGDIVRTHLVCEVAILASYHLSAGDNPFDGAAEAIAGYHERLALRREELDLIHDLTIARCLVTVAITEWRAPMNPEKRDYILKNNARSWDSLDRLLGCDSRKTSEFLHQLCGSEIQ